MKNITRRQMRKIDKMLASGKITINQAREELGLKPATEGGDRTMKVDRSEIRQSQLTENLMILHEKLCEQGKAFEAMQLTLFLQKRLKKRGKEIINIIPKQDSERGQEPPNDLKYFGVN